MTDGLRPPAAVPRVVRVSDGEPDLAGRLCDAGLCAPLPVVVLVGGMDGLGETSRDRCDLLFRRSLVPVLERSRAVLVDGGTDSGIIGLAGRARRDAGATAPSVGVVAEGTARLPGVDASPQDERAVLEPHHGVVVAVPGAQWGDEVPWLVAVATALSGASPSVTVLADGGDVAYDDVRHSLAAGRRVMVLAGTGRAADEIAAARAGDPAPAEARQAASSPLLTVVAFDPAAVTAALTAALDPDSH